MTTKILHIATMAIALTLVAMLALSLPDRLLGSQSAVVQAETCYVPTSCKYLENEDCSDEYCDSFFIFQAENIGQNRTFKGEAGSPGHLYWMEEGDQVECYRYRFCVRNMDIPCQFDEEYKQLMNPSGEFFIETINSTIIGVGPC